MLTLLLICLAVMLFVPFARLLIAALVYLASIGLGLVCVVAVVRVAMWLFCGG